MSAATGPRRHAERSRRTQAHLVAATIRVVRERSFAGATVFEVAKAAGVTPGALQHHFGSKAALMLRVVDEVLRSSGPEGIAWPDPALPAEARATALVEALWRRVYEPPRFLAVWQVYFGAAADAELQQQFAERRRGLAALLRERFAAALPELAAAPGFAAFADLVLSALRGLAVTRLFEHAPEAAAAQRAALAELIVLRLRAAGTPAKPARSRRAR